MLCLFCAFVMTLPAYAESSNVIATAVVLAKKILIGDEFHVLVQVETPKRFSVETPSAKLDLSPFELKKVDVSPFVRGENRLRRTFILTLTVFETGKLMIPTVPIRYEDGSGGHGTVRTEPVAVEILGAKRKPTDKEGQLRPPKPPVPYDPGKLRLWACGLLAGALLLFLAAKRVFRRKRIAVDPESLKPPHERAVLEIGRLKEKGFLEDRNAKEFYSELSNILRRYLERRFQIEALESTTQELAAVLGAKGFERSLVDRIKEVLQDADLVKFAKHEPPRSLADQSERAVLEIVERTKPDPSSRATPSEAPKAPSRGGAEGSGESADSSTSSAKKHGGLRSE